jgi:hypothetical protein
MSQILHTVSLSFFGYFNLLFWFQDSEKQGAGFIFVIIFALPMLSLTFISFGLFLSNLINVLKGKYNYDYQPSVDIKLVQKLGIDEIEIKSKLNRLYKIWWGNTAIIPESNGKVFITTLLEESLNDPIILSIIADDVTCFVTQFTKRYNKKGDRYYFYFCCVCGAENIITKFFFENKDRKQRLLDSENAIAFAISSGNNNLVKQLATIAKELGKKDLGPLALYSAGNSSGIDLVSKVFSESSPITSSK